MTELTPFQAFAYGILHALGRFDISSVSRREKQEESAGFFAASQPSSEDAIDTASERTYFALGETLMAALLALGITVPAAFRVAQTAGTAETLSAAALLFLPLFIFLPKLIRYLTRADTGAVIAAFGKNEQMKKVFWTIFLALAAGVLAQVLDPAIAANVIALLAGT